MRSGQEKPGISGADPAADRPLSCLFIDFNAYFAGVEQHDHPELMGKPVIVTPLASEHTGAIAASYEARPFGIKRGTKVADARKLCPGIAVMPARHDRYVAVHKQLMAEIERHIPLEKVYSVDEAAFRLSRSERDPARAMDTARRIKEGIARNVGPALRSSIGIAPTRLLAKLAAERVKPDGLTVLRREDLPHALEDIPLTDIPGIGAGVAARLARADVNNFMALWRLQPKQARAIWGSVMGERFWHGLHGFETVEEPTKKSMIGHSRVLTREHETPEKARIVARALLLKAASRLRHYKMHASSVSLSVRIRPEGGWQSARRFKHSQDSFLFLNLLDEMWSEFCTRQRQKGPLPRLGGVTVYLHGLAECGETALEQMELFAEPEGIEKNARRADLWKAIDDINADLDAKFQRLGAPAAQHGPRKRHISLASQSGLALNYLGVKIAFSRVPEEAEFLY
ncbi:Y-family DNA polymerase [Marinicaulis aureus]|uniref:DNA-directed DNA polymerase n=1 Tax=Hyphococcus aureus TaxID=2666033 RepID=A0ABW1L1I2_9PROT